MRPAMLATERRTRIPLRVAACLADSSAAADGPVCGEQKPERGALAVDRIGADGAAVHLHELLAQGQAQTGPLDSAAGRTVDLTEFLKQLRHVLSPDSHSLVRHRNPHDLLGTDSGPVACPVSRPPEWRAGAHCRQADLAALSSELGCVG